MLGRYTMTGDQFMHDRMALSLAWNQFVRAAGLVIAEPMPRPTAIPASHWRAIEVMVAALESLAKSEAQRLSQLLMRSDEYMKPLGDPFRLQFGTHRWLDLAREREETYSDWLVWLIQGLNSATDIVRIFGLENVPFGRVAKDSRITEVSREEPFRTPEGDRKKFDLVVRFGNGAVLLVEIKVRPLEEAGGSENLPIYYQQLKMEQPDPDFRQAVLLVPEMADISFQGWDIRSWDKVSLTLRQIATRYCRREFQDLLRAATLLSFAGAVEQNVLRLGQTELSAPQTAAYIERFLTRARI
jgi:hypothetical protein